MQTVKTYKGHDVPEGAQFFRAETTGYGDIFVKTVDGKQYHHGASKHGYWELNSANFTGLIPLPKQTPEQYMPEVGDTCELINSTLFNREYVVATILFIGESKIMYNSDSGKEQVALKARMKFRPIKTERERFIEQALKTYNCGKYSVDMAEALFDNGARFSGGEV